MLSCREATRLMSDSLDQELPWSKRARLKIHLALCKHCRRFEEQSRLITVMSNRYFGLVEGTCPEERLSAEARARIQQALNDE